MLSEYQKKLQQQKMFGKVPEPKKIYHIPKVSEKKKKELALLKEMGSDDSVDTFFHVMRPTMTGKCLFCGGKTQKDNDDNFFFSQAHLLPKSLFKSVATHPEILIELCFYNNSCHTNFDNGKITWEFLKDSKEWEVIYEKLLLILPAVAPFERKNKLYSKLIELVYGSSSK